MTQHSHETCFVWCLTNLVNRDSKPVSLFAEPTWGQQPIPADIFRLTNHDIFGGVLEVIDDWSLTIVDLIITQPWVTVELGRVESPGRSRTLGGPRYSVEATSTREPLNYRIGSRLPHFATARSVFPTTHLIHESVVIAATIGFNRF